MEMCAYWYSAYVHSVYIIEYHWGPNVHLLHSDKINIQCCFVDVIPIF